MAKREREELKPDDGLQSKLVRVNRITKTTKGGRNMRFAALIVVGDGKGRVGMGTGKAAEVPEAIKKAELRAKRSMVKIAQAENTIPHKVVGKYGKATVLMMPAPEGTGVIAGTTVRSVVELAGVKDITTKCYGSRNPINAVKAVFDGLSQLRTPEQVAALRDKTVDELLG